MVLWMSEIPSWANPVNGLEQRQPGDSHSQHSPEESYRSDQPPCPCLELLHRQHCSQRERVVDWNSDFQRESHTVGSSCVENLTKAEVLPKYKWTAKTSDCLNPSGVWRAWTKSKLFKLLNSTQSVMTAINTCHLHTLQSYKQFLSTL